MLIYYRKCKIEIVNIPSLYPSENVEDVRDFYISCKKTQPSPSIYFVNALLSRVTLDQQRSLHQRF